jgi:hypothetical protein
MSGLMAPKSWSVEVRMTRRFGYWIIGTALGLAPLAGCAQWGGRNSSTSFQDTDDAQLLAFWDHQFHGSSTSVARSAELDKTPVVHESKIEPPQTTNSQDPAAGTKESDKNPPPPEPISLEPAPALLTPGAGDLPGPLPVPPVPVPPAQHQVEAEPTVPVTGHVDSGRREPLVEALQCIIDNRASEALPLLRKYAPANQEVFLRLLPILALMTQKSIDQLTPPEVAVFNEQLHILSDEIRPLSKLAIDKACFCEWIKSYGDYKWLPEGHAFLGSTPNRPGEFVQLYVELRNFASEAKNGYFATRLSSSVEIRDQKGDQVWFHRFEDSNIRSRTLLHDYCNNCTFYVPNTLPAGTYTLIIQVTDETRPKQARVASKSLEFRVTSMSARIP